MVAGSCQQFYPRFLQFIITWNKKKSSHFSSQCPTTFHRSSLLLHSKKFSSKISLEEPRTEFIWKLLNIYACVSWKIRKPKSWGVEASVHETLWPKLSQVLYRWKLLIAEMLRPSQKASMKRMKRCFALIGNENMS